MDSDGYGYAPDDRGTARLLDDLRTLSPSAIERVAHGWELHALPDLDRYHAAETAALKAVESAHLTTDWEALQREILDLTEQAGVTLRLARLKPAVRELLTRDGVLDRVGEDKTHGNIEQAVEAQIVAGGGGRADL